MLPSMSRPSNPYDNATCENILKSLKREEINATTYRDFEDLQKRLDEFIEGYYNVCRLHSTLDYRSPEDFEKVSQREIPENVSGVDDDVLRRLMRASSRAVPFD